MNEFKKIIVISCIFYLLEYVKAQKFNTVIYEKNLVKIELHNNSKDEKTDSTFKEDYLKPDTLSKIQTENLYLNTKNAICAMPLKHIVLRSMFGYRNHPILKVPMFHSGIDLAARSAVVYSILEGVIEKTGYNTNLGNYIVVNHGFIKSIYGHLSFIGVKQNDLVEVGEGIAITGRTGRATGEHLHFMIKFDDKLIDPWPYLKHLFRKQIETE